MRPALPLGLAGLAAAGVIAFVATSASGSSADPQPRTASAAPVPAAVPAAYAAPGGAGTAGPAPMSGPGVQTSPAPAAPERGGSDCDDLAASHRSLVPPGWVLECADELPPAWATAARVAKVSGMSNMRERRIIVLRGQSREYTAASIVHELAHATSSSWPQEVKDAFAAAVGQPAWRADDPYGSPSEIYAESTVACRGMRTNPRYPLAPCSLLQAAEGAAAAASALVTDVSPMPGSETPPEPPGASAPPDPAPAPAPAPPAEAPTQEPPAPVYGPAPARPPMPPAMPPSPGPEAIAPPAPPAPPVEAPAAPAGYPIEVR